MNTMQHTSSLHWICVPGTIKLELQTAPYAPNRIVASGAFSYSGQAYHLPQLHGRHSQNFARPLLNSSSRTTCLPREGEMLWSAACMNDTIVAEKRSQERVLDLSVSICVVFEFVSAHARRAS